MKITTIITMKRFQKIFKRRIYKILDYDITNVSESIDDNKTSPSKAGIICHF